MTNHRIAFDDFKAKTELIELYNFESSDWLTLLKNDKAPSNKYPGIRRVICQEEELKDSLDEDQKGEHEYISINENQRQRQYHSYNNLVESGFYEAFVWEQNRGLVSYWSGFGAAKDGIELYLESED